MSFNIIVILGPTASGKTGLAAAVASRIGGEIISADSRQVFRGMDIGSGKDLSAYEINGQRIRTHLIDIMDAGAEYSVFRFQNDFSRAVTEIRERGNFPLLCGGTGLYIESVLESYALQEVPRNEILRETLSGKSMQELLALFSTLRTPHSTTDTLDRDRLLRAIEIETWQRENCSKTERSELRPLIIGILMPREVLRERIRMRLEQRLTEGLVEEVKSLISSGVPTDRLMAYGLEYRFITRYLQGELDFDTMTDELTTAIRQFAKRQMTWFRRMERKGHSIRWINGLESPEEQLGRVLQMFSGENG